MNRLLVSIAAGVMCLAGFAQTTLIGDGGKRHGRILVNDSSSYEAGVLMQDFLTRMSGREMPLVSGDAKPRKGDVVILP